MNRTGPTRRDILRYCLGLSIAAYTTNTAAASDECPPTRQDDLGPFYISGAPRRTAIAGPDEPGDRTIISGKVLGADCNTPLSGALLDVWHADAKGHYHNAKENYRLRGQLTTNKAGAYEFSSIRPGNYTIDTGAWRPAHFHFTVSYPGYEPLTTQLYFKGDPHLAPNDACGADCHSDDPNRIIELRRSEKGGKVWLGGTFDIVLKPHKT